jgi:hypothetical protein
MKANRIKNLLLAAIVSTSPCSAWATDRSDSTEQPKTNYSDLRTDAVSSRPVTPVANSVQPPNEAPSPTTAPRVEADSSKILTDSLPPSDSLGNSKPHTSFARKCLSVVTAACVGTPICVVRRSKYEEWYGVHGMIGDSDSKFKKVLAGAIWLPCALICGAGEAPFDAVANSLMYPAFSKDQMSKGKLIQNN